MKSWKQGWGHYEKRLKIKNNVEMMKSGLQNLK